MAQITSGIRSLLSNPWMYDASQNIMGARKIRDELVAEFIRPQDGQRILDVGCGTAEILSALPDTVDYVGFDISKDYINESRQRFGSKGEFHCGLYDSNAALNIGSFDTAIILGALHHMDDDVARDLLQLIFYSLKPGGRLVTIDPCFDESQSGIARFLISKDRGQNVRTLRGYETLPDKIFSRVNIILRHRSWIPYTHCIMECFK